MEHKGLKADVLPECVFSVWDLENNGEMQQNGASEIQDADERMNKALEHIVGPELVQLALEEAPTLSEEMDKIFWKCEPSGCFSTKSALELVRRRGMVNGVLSNTWNSISPLQSKLLVWKIFHKILPVDLEVKKRGIQLASRCVCCQMHEEESLQHVFVEGELANKLWKFFVAVFGVPIIGNQSIYARLAWWFHKNSGESHFAIMGRLAAIAICRQIWTFRNNIIYGEVKRSYHSAQLIVVDSLQHMDFLIKPKARTGTFGIDSMEMLGIKVRQPCINPGRIFPWQHPPPGYVVLNVDGSTVRGKMAIGGVVRDSAGNVLVAVAGPIGSGDCLQAEIWALHYGIQLLKSIDPPKAIIWTDSKVLVEFLEKAEPYGRMSFIWNQVRAELEKYPWVVQHSLREGNRAADRLAAWGHSLLQISVFTSASDLPNSVRQEIRFDKGSETY